MPAYVDAATIPSVNSVISQEVPSYDAITIKSSTSLTYLEQYSRLATTDAAIYTTTSIIEYVEDYVRPSGSWGPYDTEDGLL